MRTLLVIACAGLAACTSSLEDGRHDRFDRSDDGTGPESNPAVARGVARLINDVGLSTMVSTQPCAANAGPSCLPGIGLQRKAAEGIVAARPFEFDRTDPLAVLRKLDDVPFVGQSTFDRLVDYAVAHGFVGDSEGPDIGIDPIRLQKSARVIANATVQQAEVAEGCAGDTSGRTLIRFDAKTPNFGPGDLIIGQVACISTRNTATCRNVSCGEKPGCCTNGDSVCQSSNPDYSEFFSFAAPHSHIHFDSFAAYSLLTTDGEIAADGHKQSFCLMDIEQTDDDDFCETFQGFTCGFQGIHAGCADVYSSALPCSFVDATGVAPGTYLLRVEIDPQDAIAESNEFNNVVVVPVRIGDIPPPPPAPDGQHFLVRDGSSSAQEGTAYYASLEGGESSFTLAQWEDSFMTGSTVSAVYRNKNELGFIREMTCTKQIGRGVGGCRVANYNTFEDVEAGIKSEGTVAMRLDTKGRTQFFAFNPDGELTPLAVLDDEGPKGLPRLCTNCHGGEYRGAGFDPDLGSVFREFEPSLLERRPGITASQAEQEWFALNQAINSANLAVRSEAEGGPFGVDNAVDAMLDLVDEIYPSGSTLSLPVSDLLRVPASWKTGDTSLERILKRELWTKFTSRYCMSCHRTSVFDFTGYAHFLTVSALSDGRPMLLRYIEEDPNDPERRQLPFMPQSKLQWQNLRIDAEALLAVEKWLQFIAQTDGARQ